MTPFDYAEAFWRRHPVLTMLVFGLLALLAVTACQLDQSGGSGVVYQNF